MDVEQLSLVLLNEGSKALHVVIRSIDVERTRGVREVDLRVDEQKMRTNHNLSFRVIPYYSTNILIQLIS